MEAGIVMFQEHRVPPDQLTEAQMALEAQGWHVCLQAAQKTDKHGWSGGVGIVLAQHIGVERVGFAVPDWCSHRVAICVATVPTDATTGHSSYMKIAVVSLYLQVGSGMGQYNMAVVAWVFGALGTIGLPWFIGGDFNVGPKALHVTGMVLQAQGTITAPSTVTCVTRKSTGTLIDFGVVDSQLEHLVVGQPKVQEVPGLYPHRAVTWHLRLGDSHTMV